MYMVFRFASRGPQRSVSSVWESSGGEYDFENIDCFFECIKATYIFEITHHLMIPIRMKQTVVVF